MFFKTPSFLFLRTRANTPANRRRFYRGPQARREYSKFVKLASRNSMLGHQQARRPRWRRGKSIDFLTYAILRTKTCYTQWHLFKTPSPQVQLIGWTSSEVMS